MSSYSIDNILTNDDIGLQPNKTIKKSHKVNSMRKSYKTVRCICYIYDKGTKRYRKCKNKSHKHGYCYTHNHSFNEVGRCCFCSNECNILSQSCGRCARIASWYGANKLYKPV